MCIVYVYIYIYNMRDVYRHLFLCVGVSYQHLRLYPGVELIYMGLSGALGPIASSFVFGVKSHASFSGPA